mgnify:FL=1
MNLKPSNQLSLFGHHIDFQNFANLYLDKRLPNKILLSGEKGIGKSTLSYHLINFILSKDEDLSYDVNNFVINPENKSFKLIINKSNPNFISIDVIDDKKSIDINQIRNLILTSNKSSFNNKPRFVLIDNIELLNINSVNALLKILEEPNYNIYFILINNNKKILPTLKSRCINFKIHLSSSQFYDITNKILNDNFMNLINPELINNYSTPGKILYLLDFANQNDIDLKEINLKELIKKIIMEKKYKKDLSIKHLLYSLIEIYFRKNISIKNTKLIDIHNYFLKKINNTKIFNLDDESLLMEFDERVLDG